MEINFSIDNKIMRNKILSMMWLTNTADKSFISRFFSVTYNALMLVEMLLLCYAARHVYYVDLEKNQEMDTTDRVARISGQAVDPPNNDNNKQLTVWNFELMTHCSQLFYEETVITQWRIPISWIVWGTSEHFKREMHWSIRRK